MILIVGLGNPGKPHHRTRHNLGARVVEALRSSLQFPDWQEKPEWRGRTARTGATTLFLPATFMNESGVAVQAMAASSDIPPERIWIVSDDVDLPFLETRLRTKGSAGGHKGLRSVIDALKTEGFNRFRIGIGSNRETGIPSESYVLQPFTQDEERQIADALPRVVAELRTAIGI